MGTVIEKSWQFEGQLLPRLPVVFGHEAIRAFERLGYYKVRQEGSHVRMKCDENGRAPITLVAAKKDVKPKLLKRAISDAGYTVQEFL